MTGTIQPPDQVDKLSDLQQRYPGHEVCLVRRMPPGLRWCVDDKVIYVRADTEPPRSTLDIIEAMEQLDGFRPELRVIVGGLTDEQWYATGSD